MIIVLSCYQFQVSFTLDLVFWAVKVSESGMPLDGTCFGTISALQFGTYDKAILAERDTHNAFKVVVIQEQQ